MSIDAAAAAGIDDYVSKPIRLDYLADAVNGAHGTGATTGAAS